MNCILNYVHSLLSRFAINRAQPIGILSYLYMLSLFGIYLPWQATVWLFNPLILLTFTGANFAFFTIIDWPTGKVKNRFTVIWTIYFVLLTGLAIEVPSLYGHAEESIFHGFNTENKNIEGVSTWLVPYSLAGNFLIDAYFFYISTISNRITLRLISKVLQGLL